MKEQNNLLLGEIGRLREANKKYRKVEAMQRVEIEQLREECGAQRGRADELRDLILSRMGELEERVRENCPSEMGSFLEILEMSRDMSL